MAEYRAIFGGAGADLRLLGALQMKVFSHIANGRDGCTLGAVLEVKKEIPVIWTLCEVRECGQSARPERRINCGLVQKADGLIPAFHENLRASSKLMMTWLEMSPRVAAARTRHG